MTSQEKLGVLVFLGLIACTYATAAVIVARWAWRKIRHRPAPERRRWRRAVRVGIVAAAVLGILCAAYGRWIEPCWLEVTRVELAGRLPAGADPVRIVHISDLHSEAEPRLEERLPDVIADLDPDVIVFTGDALNTLDGAGTFRRCMTRLARIAPTFAIRGNWDNYHRVFPKLYDDTGVTPLEGRGELLEVGRTKVWIGGTGSGSSAISRALSTAPDDAYVVFCYHYPGGIYDAAAGGADLYLAGHTHGGQVALPFYGALVTLSKYGKRFEAGHYRVAEMDAYVNRGIGMEGRWAPRVRFLARPEVTLLTIRP